MGLNNVSSSGEDAVFTDIEAESLGLPSGYTINEDNGDLVVRDTTGTVALRRVDGGNWSFAGNTVEANQVGTSATPATLESDNINNSGQVTTQDLTVNGSTVGVGGGIQLEAGDSIQTSILDSLSSPDRSFITLFNGSASTILGGVFVGREALDFQYTFSTGDTVNLNNGDGYDTGNFVRALDGSGDKHMTLPLPPAKDVTKVEIGHNQDGSATFSAILYRLV
jgi:hypothetical protein